MMQMTVIKSVLDDLAESVAADIEAGITEEEVDRDVIRTLRSPVSAAASIKKEPARVIDNSAELSAVAAEVSKCTKCSLHKTRTNTVPGQGSSSPEIMFVGEAPGADEDEQGLAFVGRAGKLLTKMIEAMGFSRDEVFIGNILKCRPPDNRPPMPDEMAMCKPYLLRQIKLLKPKVIIALGATAVKGLLEDETAISKLRGKWSEFGGVPLMPTYHPAYLLRSPSAKHDAWADLQAVLKRLGRKAPPVKKSE